MNILHSKYALAVAWVGLAIATMIANDVLDPAQVVGPALVGILAIAPLDHSKGLYHIVAFAVVVDRVVKYLMDGVWTPLFVWLLVFIYVVRSAREEVQRTVPAHPQMKEI